MCSTNSPTEPPDNWNDEIAFARKVIDDLIARFPDNLRTEALRIGYELQKISEDPHASESLGGYFRPSERIRLYLPLIKEESIREAREYARDLELTYLHEFGHHLGMEEKHLEDWGL